MYLLNFEYKNNSIVKQLLQWYNIACLGCIL
uniref:Uncharacterized protein n=1 Tax=Siphoviridae sp. ctlXU33 TaxID=2823598 RepID=A0A8S5LF99_9CAUD|nr:MAG TPA: hypothetical protein [Siphoviridae sp. ctlXU33]